MQKLGYGEWANCALSLHSLARGSSFCIIQVSQRGHDNELGPGIKFSKTYDSVTKEALS